MKLAQLLTPRDLARIEEAVRGAEGRSRGEIVTVAVDSSDDYDDTVWFGAALGAALAGALAAVLFAVLWGNGWGGAGEATAAATAASWPLASWAAAPWIWIALPPLLGGLLGHQLVARIGALRRWLTPTGELDGRVRARAEQAFLEHEVFDTRDRSGVLLFLSLFEHHFVVLGDAGIDERVRPGEWSDMVSQVVEGIRAGRAGDALVGAIERCGEILERPGLELRDDDDNELPDGLRYEP